MVMDLQTHEWYMEGRTAYANSQSANPYEKGSLAYNWWSAGWESAADDEIERQILNGQQAPTQRR